jgi:hypothetical protein
VATAVANAESRAGLARLADEQAALGRVATLVAEGAPPPAVFDAVAAEMATLLDADGMLVRYEPDDELTVLTHRGFSARQLPPGTRVRQDGASVSAKVSPDGEWECALGDYAELIWPKFDIDGLAPILAGRLERRGITGWITLGVKVNVRGPVAEFGVPEISDELGRALRDAAAPLPVTIHRTSRRPRRVSGLSQ